MIPPEEWAVWRKIPEAGGASAAGVKCEAVESAGEGREHKHFCVAGRAVGRFRIGVGDINKGRVTVVPCKYYDHVLFFKLDTLKKHFILR